VTEEEWVDDSPVVRPYALTGGRTRPASAASFDLLARVAATGLPPAPGHRLSAEHLRLLTMVTGYRAVAEVVAESGLPLGVVRVLLDDLLTLGLILVRPPSPQGTFPGSDLLNEVLKGLRSL
jgi:hypothetical protein